MVEALRHLPERLVIAGDGPELSRPRSLATAAIRSHALRWSDDRFRDAIRDAVVRAAT